MRNLRSVFVMLIAPALCLSSVLPPFNMECALLDRVSAVAASNSPANRTALTVLQQVALKGPAGGVPGLEAEVRGRPGEFLRPDYQHVDVRVHALRAIGRAATAEAVTFLSKLTREQLGPDSTGQLWPAAQLALREALYQRIRDPRERIEFLERTIQPRQKVDNWGGTVVSWAVHELCDNGVVGSLPLIAEAIKKRDKLRAE
jgi:hypothetical protein